MEMAMKILAASCMFAGAVFMTIGSIGIIRMSDFYRRLHAVSMSDTLGIILFTAGMVVYSEFTLVSFKLAVIFLFISITNPVGSHALARAAYRSGLRPWKKNQQKIEGEES
jgi:multicomponent Na+:H+ antiporter subunit G